MEFYTVIDQRRTIRDLKDKEIPMETIYKIINAGLRAPTNNHLRQWEYVVITEKEEKARIINKIPKTYSNQSVVNFIDSCNMTDTCQREMYMDAVPKQYSMLYQSGCLILPFFRQDHPLLKPECLSSLNAFASIWCCINNILLAATAEGLAGVTRIPFDHEIEYLKEAIGHPDNYYIPCYISLGYPTDQAVNNSQHIFDAKDKIHINHW